MRVHQVDFIVAGSGDFPADMLRYDACHPVLESDALTLTANLRIGPSVASVSQLRAVALRGQWEQRTKPTIARWNSFGWSVLAIDAVECIHLNARPRTIAQHSALHNLLLEHGKVSW